MSKVDELAVGYTKYPITLYVKDDGSLTSSVSLTWKAKTNFRWYSCHKIDAATYEYGVVTKTSDWADVSNPPFFASTVLIRNHRPATKRVCSY